MNGRTYLVTGSCGFLGQFIVRAIHSHDLTGLIRALDLHIRPTVVGIERLPRVRFITGDLTRPETFAAHLAGVDTVIHSAGLIYADEQSICDCNIAGTLNLLRAALAGGCRDFIYISSISAVSCRPGMLADESMYPDLEAKRIDDPYGYSKLVCERALLAEAHRLRCITLNPSVILGPGSPRIERVISLLRRLPCCPMSTNLNSYVDVRDAAHAVVLSLANGRSGERYIVTAHNIDNLSFMRMSMEIMGKRAPVFAIPQGIYRAYDAVLALLDALKIRTRLKKSAQIVLDKAYSADKIQREMGWQPAFSLEQSIRFTLLTGEGGERYGSIGKDDIAYRGIERTGPRTGRAA